MHKFRKVAMVLLALIVLISGMGLTAQPAQASGCVAYHWVRYGESLSWIGRYYGVSWPYLASVNGIGRPYTIYAGQRLCIPGGGYRGGQPTGQFVSAVGLQRTWSFVVTDVVKDTSVTIQTYNFPSNVFFEVRMGRMQANGRYLWFTFAEDLDTDAGGSFSKTFDIPADVQGGYQMALRLIQYKKNGKTIMQDVVFYNVTGGGHGGYPCGTGPAYCPPPRPPAPCYGHPPCWGVIPTIWISSVVRDNTVTITTHNWPAGVNFQVLMGSMGTRGVGGIPVGTLYSAGGGSLTASFAIPPQLWGSRQISIRTQNWPTGYYSYNWFYNNTTY